MNKRKIIFSIVAVILIAICGLGYHFHQKIYGKSVLKSGYVYIKSAASKNTIEKELARFIESVDDFNFVSNLKKLQKIKAGRYKLVEGMTNNDLVNMLRSGNQSPVKVSFNNQSTLQSLAGRIASQIEADSISLINAFTDRTFLKENGITEAQMLGYFIPNTYEFFWNTNGVQFRDRMFNESKRFWNEDRLKKAKALNMSPNEVLALASIVYKETPKPVEQPRVAGLYLNRMKIGMPLQADPAIIYILKQMHGQDYVVKRVLKKDLKIQSPYNTYLNKGVPPSLIAMPDISAIDAVLNYERHNYLYMCVDVENLGYHAFASSIHQHNRNARKYHRWLNNQGIRR